MKRLIDRADPDARQLYSQPWNELIRYSELAAIYKVEDAMGDVTTYPLRSPSIIYKYLVLSLHLGQMTDLVRRIMLMVWDDTQMFKVTFDTHLDVLLYHPINRNEPVIRWLEQLSHQHRDSSMFHIANYTGLTLLDCGGKAHDWFIMPVIEVEWERERRCATEEILLKTLQEIFKRLHDRRLALTQCLNDLHIPRRVEGCSATQRIHVTTASPSEEAKPLFDLSALIPKWPDIRAIYHGCPP